MFQPRVYAAYLFDAVLIYAKVLTEHLQDGGSPRDGTGIMKRVLGRRFNSTAAPYTRCDSVAVFRRLHSQATCVKAIKFTD